MGDKLNLRLRENPSGMVSKAVFIEKLKELTMVFPTWKIDTSKKEVMELLYKHLGYISDDRFMKGIDAYIRKEKFNPTVAGLREYVKSHDSRGGSVRIGTVEYRNGKFTNCTEHRFGEGNKEIIVRIFEDGYSELVISKGPANSETIELSEEVKDKYFIEIAPKLIKG